MPGGLRSLPCHWRQGYWRRQPGRRRGWCARRDL